MISCGFSRTSQPCARQAHLRQRHLAKKLSVAFLLASVFNVAQAQNGTLAFTPGVISTYAGTGTAGYSGDGQAASTAQLNQPAGVAIDGAGNLYIADYGNHVVR